MPYSDFLNLKHNLLNKGANKKLLSKLNNLEIKNLKKKEKENNIMNLTNSINSLMITNNNQLEFLKTYKDKDFKKWQLKFIKKNKTDKIIYNGDGTFYFKKKIPKVIKNLMSKFNTERNGLLNKIH